MRRGRLDRADLRIINLDVIFSGNLLHLRKQCGSFRGIVQARLLFLEPLGALLPHLFFPEIDRLFGAGGALRGVIGPRPGAHPKERAPDREIDEKEKNPADGEGEYPLPLIHLGEPTGDHFVFPSSRNCAWSLGKIRGVPRLKVKACRLGCFFTFSAN